MRLLLIIFSIVKLGLSFPFPEECGVNYIQPDNINNVSSRIVGGYEAVPGSWPWQAYLKWKGSFTCGGTLIHPQWVLSAGHCFYGGEDPEDWIIVLGEHDDTIVEGFEQTMLVEKVILHPNYDPDLIDYDLTLVKLNQPVILNDHVAPACFPGETDDLETTFPPEWTCIVSGWGTIDPEGYISGPVLKQDYAQLYDHEECQDIIGVPEWVTDRMVCAGFRLTGAEDAERCMTLGFGDSGGPLVCRHPDNQRWYHIGAVSWGEFCLNERYTPGAYASIINMRQWLVDTLDENM